ncbi:MAG: deoxyguanosinetriphosphate triphosphohydrolase [Bacillota bacterium]|jgi:dGTPase
MRLYQERLEAETLSPRASLSAKSKGRLISEAPCALRTAYQRDRDRITHCKAFRRLKHKTQVFIAPEGDHYRTRLTHTLEVAQIARTVARALRLNEDLTEAIALGHDLGHTPFGHAGEEELNRIHPGGFSHNQQSLRVVDHLEKLNLTWEVRDGILNHSGANLPSTLEGQVVRICDRIAYINHDIDDGLRAGILKLEDLPRHCLERLGATTSQRINSLVLSLVAHSKDSDNVTLGPEMTAILDCLRDFMFEHVYIGSSPKQEEVKAKHVLNQVYHLFLARPHLLPEVYCQGDLRQGICDYIAGMTDRYVVSIYKSHFLPTPWHT